MENQVQEAPKTLFEEYGFGIAPYKFVGVIQKSYQAIPGDPYCPIQPGGSCDLCGTGIYFHYNFKSSDGKEFKLGSECAKKLFPKSKKMAKIISDYEKKRKAIRDEERIKAVKEQLIPSLKDKLASLPHPHPVSWVKEEQNLLTWVEWMLKCSGTAGSLRVCRIVEKIAKGNK